MVLSQTGQCECVEDCGPLERLWKVDLRLRRHHEEQNPVGGGSEPDGARERMGLEACSAVDVDIGGRTSQSAAETGQVGVDKLQPPWAVACMLCARLQVVGVRTPGPKKSRLPQPPLTI